MPVPDSLFDLNPKPLTRRHSRRYNFLVLKFYKDIGPLAQLGERRVRNAEVVGSNPMRSTNIIALLIYLTDKTVRFDSTPDTM